MRGEGALEIEDVGDREVQAFRPGRRDDMGGVAGEKKPAVAHRLGDEAAQRGDRLLDRRAGDDLARNVVRKPPLQLLPEPVVRPVGDLGIEAHWM